MKRCVPKGLGKECYNCRRWWVIREEEERREAEGCQEFVPFDDGEHPIKFGKNSDDDVAMMLGRIADDVRGDL